MKKCITITMLFACCLVYYGFSTDDQMPEHIPASKQRTGDAVKGYHYLVTGDYLKSGIPYDIFMMTIGKSQNDLQRAGNNKEIAYDYTAVQAANGETVIAPNCLQCHAQMFDGTVYIGLGNSMADFSQSQKIEPGYAAVLYKLLEKNQPKKFEASKNFLQSIMQVGGQLHTAVRGVNIADKLAALLAAHRNPQTFVWSNDASMDIPNVVVPTDVPAWWLLRKKNAMFYNGFGRGDFGRFLMASNLLTVTDTAEAREVDSHFGDVLAYIKSIQPPPYPMEINEQLAASGKNLFAQHCSGCHGNYSHPETYPNLLIPAEIIGTDSALSVSNYSAPQFVNWFNASWFTTGDHPAALVPYKGYIAPPLDGIWITAPYLHNGSVPTLEGLLNSKSRPKYWKRNFDSPTYDYDKVGWVHEVLPASEGNNVYNTTQPGYRNNGHNFGDKLSSKNRTAIIEYLKTL